MKAGITGHQNLGSPETIRSVTDMLKKAIEQYQVQQGFTSLAIGADQIFAKILLSMEIPYTAIIPSQDYETTFQNSKARQTYQRLLKHAAEVITLDFEKPGEQAYYEAGKQVVKRSDLVIAVWDGQPAKGLGGTGDQVAYARSKQKRVLHIDPINMNVSEI